MNEKLDVDRCNHCHACQRNCFFLRKYQIDIGDFNKLNELAYHCFLCGRCTAVCPKGIDGRGIVLHMRQEKVKQNRGKCQEKGYAILLAEKQDYIFRNKKYIKGKSVLFPGCNFPSFYPKTTRILIEILKQKTDMGVLFDCCGKPILELGLKNQEKQIIERINNTLHCAGAEEVVMICPNCYDFLKDRLHFKVISIYEKLFQMGVGYQIERTGALFPPCPDREKQQWVSWLTPFLLEEAVLIEGAQCCGLGGCAIVKEEKLAVGMARHIKAQEHIRIYTYCASCSGHLTRNGCQGVIHILTEIIKSKEKPDISNSLINRLKIKFW